MSEEFLRAIPEKFRGKIKNVAILVEDEPSAEIRKEEGLTEDETLFGYYHGIPQTERGSAYGIGMTLPDTVTIFQKPHEEAAGEDEKKMRMLIRETIWHEIGHFFGLLDEHIEKKRDERFKM